MKHIDRARNIYGGVPKRILDIIFSVSGLLLFSLPMLLCAAAIVVEDGCPVIFRQTRIGADLKPFVCYKFRTMRCDAPHDRATADLHDAHKYITRVGAFLRRTSLDELPQLFNVLRGDMSLIGPRPVIPQERELIALRNSLGVYCIRPGLTGLAQVRGRDSVSVRRKAAYDAQYVERMSFVYDATLMAKTLFSVICCRGVQEGGNGGR